ncbi:MAG: OmpA family protein [Myxococcales bacterium]|nr:OmpA family protein [Myxococcales bacterium]
MKQATWALLMTGLFSSGCVTAGTHQAKLDELARTQADLGKARQEAVDLSKERDDLKKRIQDALAQVADLSGRLNQAESKVKGLATERDQYAKLLNDSTALVGQLKERLEKLGQNVDKLTAERGQLQAGLTDAKTRLEEMRRQKAAAEARLQMFRNLVEKLRAMIDAGQLKVITREGRMLIALPDDVLFDSGKAEVKPQGQEALAKIAQVLSTIPDRRFLVAGHTDNVPIRSGRYRSNWDLSAARAIEVTLFLIAKGMKPQVLAAAGFGEFDPVAQNDTPEHRTQNRRIEIVLQPNLSDLPPLEGIDSAPAK